jgi:tetratricopeptide (TPR) repeat protein
VPSESASTPSFPARPGGDSGSLTAAVARARELDQSGHPDAADAWERARTLAAGADVDDLLAAELAQAQGLARGDDGDWAAAITGLHAAAAHFEAAGQPGRAAAASARAAWAAAQPDPDADVWPELDAQLGRVTELLAAGQAAPADLLTIRHARGAAAALAVQRAAAGPAAGAAVPGPAGAGLTARLDAEARALLADAQAYGSAAREAAAMSLLAFAASVAGRPADEAAALTRMSELLDQAGQPWATAAVLTRLGELALREGQPDRAAEQLERAVAIAAQWPPRGGPAAAARLLLAYARAAQGAALVAAGRGAEAIAALTEATGELGETEVAARARADLGQAYRQSGDPQSAAQQFTLATVGLSGGPDQDAHLAASLEAARSLAEAAMWPEARQAYEYARRLATRLERWAQLVRIHRELAHLCVQEAGDAGLTAAMAQLDQARAIAEAAGSAGPGGAGGPGGPGGPGGAGGANSAAGPSAAQRAELVREHGLTCYEAAQILVHAEHLEEALGWLDRAVTDLSADDLDIEALADAVYFAADLEGNALGRGEAARQRLAPVLARCIRLDAAESRAALSQLSAQLQGSSANSGTS